MNITFLGGGNMATAIITGMIQQGGFAPSQITVVQRNAEQREFLNSRLGVNAVANLAAVTNSPDLWILAVKPQTMKDAPRELTPILNAEQIVL